MPSIYVRLSDKVYRQLCILAMRERRETREQAAWIIECALVTKPDQWEHVETEEVPPCQS